MTTTPENTTDDTSNDVQSNAQQADLTATDDTAAHNAPRMVPVTEAIRYRKRARQAEQTLEQSRSELLAAQQELEQAQQTISQLEQRHRIRELLRDCDAVDLDVAHLLTESAVAQMPQPDIELAVEDLRRSKPYLFHRQSSPLRAMAAHVPHRTDPVDQAAHQALASGRRRDLLQYLRLRRQA